MNTISNVRVLLVPFVIACVMISNEGRLSATVTFDWVTVGNPGNGPDQDYGNGKYGSVERSYRISKYNVTNDQFREYLNIVDPDGLNLNSVYNHHMGSSSRGGIARDRTAPSGQVYSTKPNMGNKPLNFVSYIVAMKFVNWLENGQPTDGSGTLSGVYQINDGISESRAPGSRFFIPNENEWYKAAYYDSRNSLQGGPLGDDNYWLYPTASDSGPTTATANATGDIDNPGLNVANFASTADWNGHLGNLTTVGTAGADSASFFGTFDQGGNTWEWNETLVDSTFRGMRGGSWNSTSAHLAASSRFKRSPTQIGNNIGFRIASVPEPNSILLAGFAILISLPKRTVRSAWC
jgi:sulfatase modifying factor 1